MKYQIPRMLTAGAGSIVNIASVNATKPLTQHGSYTATKHGIVGVSQSAQLDYVSRNIRINVVSPGVTDTPMVGSGGDLADRATILVGSCVPAKNTVQAGTQAAGTTTGGNPIIDPPTARSVVVNAADGNEDTSATTDHHLRRQAQRAGAVSRRAIPPEFRKPDIPELLVRSSRHYGPRSSPPLAESRTPDLRHCVGAEPAGGGDATVTR